MRAIRDRVRLGRQLAGRWAVGPLAVRTLLLLAGLTTLGLAMPSRLLLGRFTVFLVAGAVVVAMAPRGRLVSVLLLIAGFGWMASTILFDDRVVMWRLVGLAMAMYLVHTLAALASVLPYDAVLPPGVVAGWLLRAAVTLVVSAGLGIFAMVEAPLVVGPVYLLASVGGVAVVGALAWVLTRGVRR
ncbi:MAG: hypothetical protein HKP61_22735 [Dactylosporangium sp.]|nr:hypothetical protein [Dactylosporangium sp.]NNJ63694.1 hypothetical protein [Dactylosporangium sp.]